MSAAPTITSTMQNRKAYRTVENLPAEIKLQIFTHCTDFETVDNLRLVSASFAGVFKESSRTIMKRIMEQLAGPGDSLKLAAMAIESSRIGSQDESAIDGFLQQYIDNGEVLGNFYDRRNIAPLSSLLSAASTLVALRSEGNQKMLHSLLRVEIARNLFHRRMQYGAITFTAQFPELETKYWLSHSASQIEDLSTSRDILSLGLHQAIHNTRDCPQQGCCFCGGFVTEDAHRRVCEGHSQDAGLEELANWLRSGQVVVDISFCQFQRQNRSHFELVNYYNHMMGAESGDENPQPIIDIAIALQEQNDN